MVGQKMSCELLSMSSTNIDRLKNYTTLWKICRSPTALQSRTCRLGHGCKNCTKNSFFL